MPPHEALRCVFPCQPATERGKGLLIGWHEPSNYISYCNGKLVVLRSLNNPSDCLIYTEHSYPTTVARISPNGEWIASADTSGTVRVWGRRGEQQLKLEVRAIGGRIDDLMWSGDSQRIVACGEGKQSYVRAFTWDSGSGLGDFDGHSKRVLSCAFRPIRPFRVFSAGEDFQVNYYEGPPFRFKASNKDHTNYVNCVRFSPDASKLVSVASDKTALLFDGKTGARTGAFDATGGHTGSIYAAAWSPDGKQVVTVSADKTAKIWDVAEDGSTATVAASVKVGDAIEHMQLGCAWVGPQIATILLSSDICLISPSLPSSPPKLLFGHSKLITAAVALPNTAAGSDSGVAELVTGSYDGTIVRWDAERGPVGRAEGIGQAGVVAMAVAADSLLVATMDDKLHILSSSTLSPLPSSPAIPLGSLPKSISVAAQNPSLAVLVTVKGVVLVSDGKVLSTIAPGFEATAAAVSPSGAEVAVGSSEGVVHVFEVRGDSLEEVGKLERHRAAITTLQYSPDGLLLATGDQNREVVVWDAVAREIKVKNLVYHNARVTALAWAPDSQKVATASLDTSIIIYDIAKPPSARYTIENTHVGGVSAITYLGPSLLASAGNDACVRLWNV